MLIFTPALRRDRDGDVRRSTVSTSLRPAEHGNRNGRLARFIGSGRFELVVLTVLAIILVWPIRPTAESAAGFVLAVAALRFIRTRLGSTAS